MVRSSVPRKILGVIPARFASTRFPGKVLAQIAGKTMLQHVYERASLATYLTSVIIATDDERVYGVAKSFGARVRMTRSDHLSGTDRVAEVASAEDAGIIVNIQGDEPLISPTAIDAAILPLVHEPDLVMGTLKKRMEDRRNYCQHPGRRTADLSHRHRRRHPAPGPRAGPGHGDAQETRGRPPRNRRPQRGEGGDEPLWRCDLFLALRDSLRAGKVRRHALFQAHRVVRLQPRFSAPVFGAAGGSAGDRGTPGAVARFGERVSYPRGGDGIRVAGCGYAGGSGKGVQLVRRCNLTGKGKWLNTYL